jgi:DnaK suppressor protein
MNLNKAKRILLDKQLEIEARIERTHKHTYGREEPVNSNLSEQAKETENDFLVRSLEEEGKEELQKIHHALERIEAERYQFCSNCNSEIAEERLISIPYTDKCITCANNASE